MPQKNQASIPATKIVLSDLHIGAGRVDDGNRLEDFTKDEELSALVRQLAEESDAKTLDMELILNGDIFEFWQVPALENPGRFDPRNRYPVARYLSTFAEHARRRMMIIVQGHPQVFAALADFLHRDNPKRSIAILKGNHDMQIYWPEVQAVIRDALDAHGEYSGLVSFPPRAISRDGVYIEHGSEYADPLNIHPDFDVPLHPWRPERLREVPGASISIRVVNRMERDHFWISSVKPIPALFWFLLRFEWRAALRVLILMLPHFPKLLWLHRPLMRSNKDLMQDIAEMEAEQHDEIDSQDPRLPTCYSGRNGDLGLLNLPSLREMLTDEEVAEDPLLVRGLLEEHHLHALMHQVARLKIREEKVCVVIFGHTHVPSAELLDGNAVFINTGSWTWMLDLSEQPADAWRRLIRHEDFQDVHYHLTYARVDYDPEGLPKASLNEYWPDPADTDPVARDTDVRKLGGPAA